MGIPITISYLYSFIQFYSTYFICFEILKVYREVKQLLPWLLKKWLFMLSTASKFEIIKEYSKNS